MISECSDKNEKGKRCLCCSVCGFRSAPTGSAVDMFHHECKQRGLGDAIAAVTSFFRIAPCKPCQERQKALNEMFPFNTE